MGIAVQGLFAYRGIDSDHIVIRTTSYQNTDDLGNEELYVILQTLKFRKVNQRHKNLCCNV